MIYVVLMLNAVLGTADDAAAGTTPTAAPPVLTWETRSQSVIYGWSGGNFAATTNQASNHVGLGYTDWRLPTRAELIAAVQSNALAGTLCNGPGFRHYWTSDTRGSMRTWTVRIETDANSYPVFPQNPTTYAWGNASSIDTIYVRP